MRPVPPGEILNEEFLKPLGLTANALAKAIGMPMAAVHFAAVTAALLAAWMAVRAKASALDRINATDFSR